MKDLEDIQNSEAVMPKKKAFLREMKRFTFSVRNDFKKTPARGYCQFCTHSELKPAMNHLIKKVQPQKK